MNREPTEREFVWMQREFLAFLVIGLVGTFGVVCLAALH